MMIKRILLFTLLLSSFGIYAQEPDSIPRRKVMKRTVVMAHIRNNDTLPVIELPEVNVVSWRLPDNKRELRQYHRLIYHVKKAYPYAKLAGIKLNEYESVLQAAETDKERRKLMKQAEKDLDAQFGSELRNLTFSQGKILIKLIDRETKETSYELLKELRGGVTAFFYQGFARIWGYNLKTPYNPNEVEEDAVIEWIIHMIEKGEI